MPAILSSIFLFVKIFDEIQNILVYRKFICFLLCCQVSPIRGIELELTEPSTGALVPLRGTLRARRRLQQFHHFSNISDISRGGLF